MQKATNIVWHANHVTPEQRAALTCVKPAVLWLTGLSGSGKSTIAMALEATLVTRGHLAFTLDGDNVRHGLNKNLGFSDVDRTENIRRIGEVAKLFVSAGLLTITSFISPFRSDRAAIRALFASDQFIEVFIDAPLELCEQRDTKGLYKKAHAALAAGKGLAFTGIDSPYEPPLSPELHLRTGQSSLDECVQQILRYLSENNFLQSPGNGR